MAKLRKLTPAKIRHIYKSTSSARLLAAACGVSPHMIYLIRSGRAHGGVTQGLKRVKLHRGRPNGHAKPSERVTAFNISYSISSIAKAVVNEFIARLK